MGEIGKVIKVNGNKVTVELERKEACAKCRACSVGMKSQTMNIECTNNCNAKIDDKVEIMLGEKSFFTAVLIMYGIPFVCFLIGVIGGYYGALNLNINNAELIGFILGIILVAISYLWIKSKESYWRSKDFVPIASRIVTNLKS